MNVSSLFVGYLLLKAVVKKMPKSCCAVGCSNHNMMNPLFIPSLIISVKVNQFIVFYVSYDVESHVNCTFLFFKKWGTINYFCYSTNHRTDWALNAVKCLKDVDGRCKQCKP